MIDVVLKVPPDDLPVPTTDELMDPEWLGLGTAFDRKIQGWGNRQHGRQLNIKCSPEFFELTDVVQRTEKLGLAECVRIMFVDRSLRYMALAMRLRILASEDLERISGECADGERSGLYNTCTRALEEIVRRDPTFGRQYGLLMAQDIVGKKVPRLVMGDVIASLCKYDHPLEFFT